VYDVWNLPFEPGIAMVDGNNLHRLSADIDFEPNTVEEEFLQWVAGLRSECPDSPDALEFGIEHYAWLGAVRGGVKSDRLYRDFAAMSRNYETGFIDIAMHSDWSRATHTRLLVEGWPATGTIRSRPVNAKTWRRSPFLGLLESLGRSESAPDLRDAVLSTLGESALSILENGADPHSAIGVFGRNELMASALSPEELDRVWRAVEPIPGALLDPFQRMIHARRLFEMRFDDRLQGLKDAGTEIRRVVRFTIQLEYGEAALAPIAARDSSRGWQSLPMLSLALAFHARMASRGIDPAVQTYQEYLQEFSELAILAPGIVEQDLVLAELWLRRWEKPWQPSTQLP
jgi:hypothetical protein